MKSKIVKSIGIAVLCLAILVGNVLAFSLGTTDGVWGQIDVLLQPACTTATDLIFSEYVYNNSGSQTDQVALEIYNGTGTAVNLSGYNLQAFYSDGGSDTFALTGTINAGDVYVIVSANWDGDTTQEDRTIPNDEDYSSFRLYHGATTGTPIDVIGSVGSPTVVPSGKQDRTYKRNVTICAGQASAWVSSEWSVESNANLDGLGSHVPDLLPGADGATCESYGAVTSASYTLWDVMGIIYNVNVGPGGEDERFVRSDNICTGDIDGDIAFATNNPAGWTRSGSASWGTLGSHTNTCSSTTGLFISEYVYDQIDGGNNDRLGVEIFNKTGASINLTTGNYSLLFFTDDRNFVKVDLSGSVANNGVFVVVNNAAAGETTNENQTITNNDNYRTVVLVQNYTYRVINTIDTDGWPETVQATPTTDENQVRYGSPAQGGGGCPTTINGFDTQSGFGFEGQIDTNFEPEVNQYFPVGRFCHYNNPITTPNNALNTVPLYLTVNDIGCPAGETYVPIAPATGNDLAFEFRVNLDETPNSANPCAYGTSSPGWPGGNSNPDVTGDVGPNRNGCADMVSFAASTSSQSFKCQISTEPVIEQEYTVSIVGFTPTTAGNECPDIPIGTIQFNQFYTTEEARSCYCVYAAYTRGQITPVVLQNLSAIGTDDGIMISWETVTETNNLGFNIMRAESKDGEQDQINAELIMSDVAPGDPFGSVYEFLDNTAVKGVTYFYWLIDVPLDGSANGIHGPISAERN